MELWQRVKVMERRTKKETWKLPEHDRTKFIVFKLPFIYNRYRNNNFVFSFIHYVTKGMQRFAKLYGIKIEWKLKTVGVSTKNHAMKLTIKVYFK